MRSLKFELGTIMKDADYWYDAVKTRLRKRKPAAETDDRARKRRRSGRLEMVEVANQDVMQDEDYMNFLSCIGSNAEEENVEEDDEEEEEEEEDDNDDDPDYRIFLKNLRANEGAYIFEMKKRGRKIRINYEEEDEYPENVRMDEYPANVRTEDDEEEDEEDEDEDDSLTPDDDIGDRGKKRRLEGNENERRKWNKSNQETSNQTKMPFLEYCKPSDVARADTSYLEFLSHLHVKGDALVFEHEEVYLRYEDEESEEDQGTRCRTKVNSPPHTTLKEVFTNEEDDDDDGDDDDSVQSLGGFDLESEYGKKLIKELRVPFKWKEYEDLLKAAKMNKEMVRDRELRTGWKTYSTGKERVSYLEHHPDLGRMVDQAIAKNDKRRALNLLRCLFYYLKHLSHDAAFVPWKDSRILGMIRSHSISKTI